MSPKARPLPATFALLLATVLACPAFAGTVGFEEDFALAPDRTASLSQLIPGTEDFYYYTALNFQNEGRLEQSDATLKAWIKQLGRTGQAGEMENRQELLSYTATPQRTLDYLTRTLDLHFNQERETQARQAALPTSLDPKLISRESFTARALAENPETLAGFQTSALDWLIDEKLSDERLHELLSRLSRPDHDNLVKLVARDLKTKYNTGFGSLEIQRNMLLAQLDDLLKIVPELLNDTQFVNIYLGKLRPAVGVDVLQDAVEHAAYLDRLWKFVSRLGPQHNSLKASILYQRLVFDRTQGVWDKDRFMAYIQLPRTVWYVNPLYMRDQERRQNAVNLQADFSRIIIILPPIRDDEPLVKSYLIHFLADAKDDDAYKPYLESTYLAETFAEAKILSEIGDQDTFAAMLPAAKLQALKDRVDLDFAYTNKTLYGPDDKVALTVNIKNVKTLIVKVYEVNAANFYKTYHREVNTDINLDGLVANEEQTVTYTDSPLRRIAREFKFDKLAARGVYVIAFIGNGKSSRALIRKGKLRYLERDGAAGQMFTILDEANKPVKGASLWMAGHDYAADADGEIQVPFSTAPGRQPIVLEAGGFASLDFFEHHAEAYRFEAGIHVARESLLKQAGGAFSPATVILRPALFLNSVRVSNKLLEEVKLEIRSVDADGISATREVNDLAVFDDRQSSYEFAVPDRLKTITFTLLAKVQNVSLNKKEDVNVSRTFTVNEIDSTDKVQDVHLSRIAGDYVLEVLGKTGELEADRTVLVSLKAHNFTQPLHLTLKSDDAGRVKLGALEGIETLYAKTADGVLRIYHPAKDTRVPAEVVDGMVGETLTIPYMGTAATAVRSAFSLLEVRDGGTFVADRFDALTLKDGFLEVKGLAAGDYDLLIKDAPTDIRIRVAAGEETDGWVVSSTRFLQIKNVAPLQIVSVAADAKALTIQLANAGKDARVEVIGTRFVPAFSAFEDLGVNGPEVEGRSVRAPESVYESGRTLGDDYRYIIDRQYVAKYPGNMLARPGLLLNPWAIRGTETTLEKLQQGQGYHGVAPAAPGAATTQPSSFYGSRRESQAAAMSDDVDFLGEPASVLVNLVPDANGVVTVPRGQLGSHQDFHIVAIDANDTVARDFSIQRPAQKVRDLRMAMALDPAKHFTEQKQITILQKGDTLTLSDASGSQLESFDSLGKVYRLYSALRPDATLAEFSFILNWPKMKEVEKREKYSKYACHELNYFLFKKDPDFFKAVVLPYLRNKRNKTFMDHYLVGDDLSGYTEPWAYGRLNVVECILLGQRVAGEQERTARHLKEVLDLRPADVERFNYLFNTALSSGGLSQGGNGSISVNMAAPTAAPMSASSNGAAYAPEGPAGAKPVTGVVAGEAQRAVEFDHRRREKDDLQKSMAEKEEALNDRDAAKDLQRRDEARKLYQALDKTMEYVENNYYHLPIGEQVAGLVKVDAFWSDLAKEKAGAGFLSTSVAEPASNFTEMMFALSVLDLPFEAPVHVVKHAAGPAGTFTLTSGGPLIAFHKEIKEAAVAAAKTPILVSQNYFREDDRYMFVDNEKSDKYVTGEFLTQVVYGCQVVITNPTSSRQKLDALLQLPQGAMPVLNAKYSQGLHLDLQPYETKAIEYAFYFPVTGQFPHYPVQVAKNEKIVASVEPTTLNVVAMPTKIDTTSWEYISQNGKPEDVLAFLKSNNVERLNLEKIAWRMKDKDFYGQVIALLRDRHVYNDMLWSYSLKHNDVENIREYLQHRDDFVAQCGDYLDSPLLKIDPVARYRYEHMEYMPLVNARAHRVGELRQILNDRFYQQYERTLAVLRYHPTLSDEDLLAVTYYLLLQDRVEEGLKVFGRIDPKHIEEKLQYDYLACYSAFYQEKPDAAAAIAEKYKEYPVDRWRNLFGDVLAQVDEIQGKAAGIVDKHDRNQQQNALASTEPTFEFRVDNQHILLTYKNVSKVTVNYYLMDIEFMFSQNPFLQSYAGQFAMIKPTDSEVVALDAGKSTMTIPLPEKFLTKNVMVEVADASDTKSQAYYANSLKVDLAENYGQLTVISDKTGKALAKVYVKVYARMQDGKVRFYKDGYTDLRGKFDYASLSTNELDHVEAFSLLILSDTDGAIVRGAGVPKR